ncbi:MAG TPA: hypothetical protein VET90_03010 [Candidatus Binatus sp.]|nr:hypothetical protein [Candidatus Binatus sp.]
MRREVARGADPLAGVERVIVDGSNLAHALGRDGDARLQAGGRHRVPAGPRPNVAVIAAVRAAFPADVRVEVVFDGMGSVGVGRPGRYTRAASNLWVEHAGRESADRVIEGAVTAQLAADGPAGTWGTLVVTDDRELRGLVQAKGARVAGTAWLAGRLARVEGGRRPAPGTGFGNARPPRVPQAPRR